MGAIERKEAITMGGALGAALVTAGLTFGHGPAVLAFMVAGVALALMAQVVGHATEHLGARLGPGPTGVLQSAFGNLPELFVGIFSLRAGLIEVVKSALIGSILANSLLVLGLAFLVGGLKNGTQKFSTATPQLTATLMTLAIAAMIVPTLTFHLHTPAAAHEGALSIACAFVLLVIFVASVPFFLKNPCAPPHEAAARPQTAAASAASAELLAEPTQPHGEGWPLALSAVVLVVAGVGAAFVSDWFVEALSPAIKILGLSQAFTGLVVVAIAGNAVENVVGIQLAARNQVDFAISVILNSSLQVAIGLTPALVLLSYVLGGSHRLDLVFDPLLIVALILSAAVSTLIVYDGESIWLEGLILIGLYGIVAASFWWG